MSDIGDASGNLHTEFNYKTVSVKSPIPTGISDHVQWFVKSFTKMESFIETTGDEGLWFPRFV